MYSHSSISQKLAIWLCIFSYLQHMPMAQKSESPGLRRRLTQSEGCILSKVETELDDGSSEGRWECELQSGDVEQAGALFVNLDGVDDSELDAQAVSGQTTFFAEGAVIADGSLSIPKGSKKTLAKIDKRGPAATTKKTKKGSKKGGRKLEPSVPGYRQVLVVRVNALDVNTTADMTTLAGDVFGIGREAGYVCLSERLNACSYGQTQAIPYNGVTPTGVTIQNGVTEIEVPITVTGALANAVHNVVLRELRLDLGIPNLSSVFDHVMLCLPPGTLGTWIAYAYVGNWLSVYNNDWCRYPSSQAHEIGHNLGLNHASEGIVVYGDRIGFMGFSYNKFNQKMCYSPAKSWQLGWYPLKQAILDFNSQGGFAGFLVGINDYQHSMAVGMYVQLKIPGVYEDYFIGFNRNTGINANTTEAMNQVTVQAQTGTGLSSLRAKLSKGNSYVIPQFLNGKDLIITVNNIKRPADPVCADVSVYLDGCPPGQCGIECHVPCPTSSPTQTPTVITPVAPPTPSPTTPAVLTISGISSAGVGNPTVGPVPTMAPPANLFTENFESGAATVFQVANGEISTKIVNSVSGSTMSLRLSTVGGQMDTLTSYYVANYQQININLWYYPTRTVSGDKVFVELSTDDGVTWTNIARINRNREFRVNKMWYQRLITWPVTAGVQSIRLRIRTRAGANSAGKIYLDDITMDGM